MASLNNVPKELLDSIRDCPSVERRIKMSIKRLVNMETKRDKTEQRVLAFSPYRLFVFTAKVPAKLETNYHYLDIKSIESKKPNHLVITTVNRSHTFTTLEVDTDEVNHMITHIGTSLKTIFPAFPMTRLIKKVEVQPSDRLRVMHDMSKTIQQKETGPCGGFTSMYACMCDFHNLTYRDEVAWDVDTIYLSQDSKELCLRDFDHLKERDLVPIVSALVHNTWFTTLNANNVKLAPDVCNEILRVMKKNSVIESLLLSNTGITSVFVRKLSTVCMSEMQLLRLDLSNNAIDDQGAEFIFGTLSSRGKMFTYIDLSKTKVTSKGLNRVSENMNRSPHVFSSLQTLKLAGLSSPRVEDLQSLYTFLASPNMLSHLDLSGTDVELEKIVAPLQRGSSQNITVLKLAKTSFTHKKTKEVVVQASFKQFFATVVTLKHLDLSSAKIPPEALKELLLGIGSNRNLKDIHLDISGVDIQGPQGAAVLQSCIPNINTIASLNISSIVFGDQDLTSVLNSIGQNKAIKHLYMGRIFQNIKPKNMKLVMEELVHVIQDEDSAIQTLSLADSKLKDSMNMIINALGSNMSLTELDISGNQMGDLGARMLSKALQINNKLNTIMWDNNNTSCVGFEDIADALNKNYTLRKMPIPVYDASAALRSQADRTEQALQTIESLLQRNHSPQKYSSDQAYRLQQGFLISSTQQMVDRLVVQSQDTIHALTIDDEDSYTNDVQLATAIIKDADNSKTLLPSLHNIAIQSQTAGNPVGAKLKEIADELKTVLEAQMKDTVAKMLTSTQKQCQALMKDKAFESDLQSGCTQKSAFPKDFTTNILTGVDTEIFNTLSEMNLAVAAHVSDRVIDEVIERLSSSHKTLTNHLNQKKKEVTRRSQNRSQKSETNQANMQTRGSPQRQKDLLNIPRSWRDSDMQSKRKSTYARKIRPQSVIDRDHLQVALDDRTRPVTVPQRHRSPKLGARSRSPHTSDSSDASRSPKPSRSPEARAQKPPRRRKAEGASPRESSTASESSRSGSGQQIPAIAVTSADRKVYKEEPIYDNVVFEKNHRKPGPRARRRRERAKDALENDQEPSLPPPTAKTKSKPQDPEPADFDALPELKEVKPLTNVTKDRARRTKHVRPNTRASALPTAVVTGTEDDIESFYTASGNHVVTPGGATPTKGDKSSRPGSNKSTPETKKKSDSHKDADKDNKEKKKSRGIGGLFGSKSSTKQSPSPVAAKKGQRVVSDIQEEPENLRRSVTENNSLRGSVDRKRDDAGHSPAREPSNRSTPSDKEDSDSIKSSKSSDSVRSVDKKSDDGTATEVTTTEKKKPPKEPLRPVKKASVKEEAVKDEVKVKAAEKDDLKEGVAGVGEEKEAETEQVATGEKEDVKVKKTEETKEQEKDTDSRSSDEELTEEEEEDESPEQAPVEEPSKPPSKPPGVPGGLGFGINIMAEMKAKQDKRQSMLISKPAEVPEKPKPAEESQPLFGAKLRSTNRATPPKEPSEAPSKSPLAPLKPADNIASEAAGKTGNQTKESSPSLARKPGGDAEDKKPSLKENGVDTTQPKRPAVIPRPGANKPPPPANKPKPPPPANKPTPAPRRSIASEGEAEESSLESSKSPASEDSSIKSTGSSEIVYDSATLKMSVKDKISKFGRTTGGATKAERPNSKGEESEAAKKRISLSKDLRKSDADKPPSLRGSTKSDDLEACDLDMRTEENPEMTDSGIVQDAGTPTGSKGKSGSLPRTAKPSDMDKDGSSAVDTPSRRPKSMMAVLGNHPSLMHRSTEATAAAAAKTKGETIPETEDTATKRDSKRDSKTDDKRSSAEDVIFI